MNGALFRGRIFCRLYLNVSLEFPSLCSAQCHMPKQTTRAVSDFRLQRLLSYCIMTADHSQPLQQQMQHGKLSAWIFAKPINRSTSNEYSSWRVGRVVPMIRSAVRTTLCSILRSYLVAELNQTVIEVQRTDSMMAEQNCFSSSCGRLNFLSCEGSTTSAGPFSQ